MWGRLGPGWCALVCLGAAIVTAWACDGSEEVAAGGHGGDPGVGGSGGSGGSGGAGAGGAGGSGAAGGGAAGIWWDEDLAQEPPETDFLFIGGLADDLYANECIYRYHPDADPEVVFCPPLAQDSLQVAFGATEAPRAGKDSILLVVEQNVLHLWPNQFYRLTVADGGVELVTELPSGYMGNYEYIVHDVMSLDGDRFVTLFEQIPSIDLLLSSTGTLDPALGLPVEGDFGTLRGRLGSGEVVVTTLNPGGGVHVVDASSDVPTLSLKLADAWGYGVSPAGVGVAYGQMLGFDGPGRAGVLGPSIEAFVDLDASNMPTVGWLDDDKLLVATGAVYAVWTHAPNQLTSLGMGDYIPRGSHRLVAGGALAFVAYPAFTAPPWPLGIGWYLDGQFAPLCGALEGVRTLQHLPGESHPVVVLDDGDMDYHRKHIYSCRPGGEPVDLLAPYGLAGRLLEPASMFID